MTDHGTGPTHVDNITCVVCARCLVGLFVRLATGVCTLCEPTAGSGVGQ
ncbi:hypothetical protein [Gordonia sp. OPL2]|nr:hypothetical protein [Gordonia sp. OPL2]